MLNLPKMIALQIITTLLFMHLICANLYDDTWEESHSQNNHFEYLKELYIDGLYEHLYVCGTWGMLATCVV